MPTERATRHPGAPEAGGSVIALARRNAALLDPALMTAVELSASRDPRWTGIVELLVSDLDGDVQWNADSAVLQLPEYTHDDRVPDLDALRLCLNRIGVPVVFDASAASFADTSLVRFLRKLLECGLVMDNPPLAA
jgi:hypothetical protein